MKSYYRIKYVNRNIGMEGLDKRKRFEDYESAREWCNKMSSMMVNYSPVEIKE